MSDFELTKVAEWAIGLLGVALLLIWLGAIGFLFSVGEVETPIMFLLVTILALIVWQQNAAAT